MLSQVLRICLGFLILVVSIPVGADDVEQTIAELRERIEALENQQAADSNTFKLYWKEGIRFDTPDKTFQMRIGGRIQNDWAFFDQDSSLEDAVGNWDDGTEFRRTQLDMQGLLYETIEFKAQYDFAGGDADFKDVYLGLKGLPVGTLRVGHFKEPFSLDELISNNYMTFLERALPNTLVPARNTGIMINNHVLEDRITYALGVFRETDNFGSGEGDGKYNVTARLTGLPLYEDEGSALLHLGLAYSHRNPGDTLSYSQRPESHLAERLINTGSVEVDDLDLVGAEVAMVYGPASLQVEYITAMVDGAAGSNPDFSGYYIQTSYFLTGEHRPYRLSGAVFSRVKPKAGFPGQEGGIGAWEIAARYSHLDLYDGGINGGELDDVTVGLNWYLNPNTRVMLNYVYADASDLYEGKAHIMQTRFQIDF